MVNIINGINYKFELSLSIEHGIFEIYSKHNISNKVSPITNTNVIISTFFNFLSKNDIFIESDWKINSKKRLLKIWEVSNQLFNDIDFILFVEKELNLDKLKGGWNSSYDF